MNTRWINVLVVALLAFAGHCHGQTPFVTNAPGTPVNGVFPGPQNVILFNQTGTGAQPYSAGTGGIDNEVQATEGIAGDIVFLTDPLGGDNPSNFLAVKSFFDPADEDGSQGLPATEMETFYGGNVPSGGFAAFPLLPNTNYMEPPPGTVPGNLFAATYVEFGPAGSIPSGEEAIFILTVAPQPAAAPEPGTLGMLGVGLAGLTVVWRGRLRARKSTPA